MAPFVVAGAILLIWISYIAYEVISKEIEWRKKKKQQPEVKKEAMEKTPEGLEADERNFLDTMLELEIEDPMRSIYDLTQARVIRWKSQVGEDSRLHYVAEFTDGIFMDLSRSILDESEWRFGKCKAVYDLQLTDAKKRFQSRAFIFFSDGDDENNSTGDILVKECYNLVAEQCASSG